MKAKIFFLCIIIFSSQRLYAQDVHIRLNLVGYQLLDPKVAIVFSNQPLKGSFLIRDWDSKKKIFTGKIISAKAPGFGPFQYYYELDFSNVT
ncbi:MAG TPA: cellulase N-terminal Ig-like domain-containing protein, partial [Cyclobacteriaceae bacterium]